MKKLSLIALALFALTACGDDGNDSTGDQAASCVKDCTSAAADCVKACTTGTDCKNKCDDTDNACEDNCKNVGK